MMMMMMMMMIINHRKTFKEFQTSKVNSSASDTGRKDTAMLEICDGRFRLSGQRGPSWRRGDWDMKTGGFSWQFQWKPRVSWIFFGSCKTSCLDRILSVEAGLCYFYPENDHRIRKLHLQKNRKAHLPHSIPSLLGFKRLLWEVCLWNDDIICILFGIGTGQGPLFFGERCNFYGTYGSDMKRHFIYSSNSSQESTGKLTPVFSVHKVTGRAADCLLQSLVHPCGPETKTNMTSHLKICHPKRKLHLLPTIDCQGLC